jgi:hypothetical protein
LILLVDMKRKDWESFSDVDLLMACIEPTILKIRGRDFSAKTQIISKLYSGQQALCMFRILYPAKNSAVDYYSWISYLLEQPNYWIGVIDGLRFFGDTPMIQLLEETAQILDAKTRENSLEDNIELQTKIIPLFKRFLSIVSDSVKRISLYIRSNPVEFVQLQTIRGETNGYNS